MGTILVHPLVGEGRQQSQGVFALAMNSGPEETMANPQAGGSNLGTHHGLRGAVGFGESGV